MKNTKLRNKKSKQMDIHVQIHGNKDAITYHKLIKQKDSNVIIICSCRNNAKQRANDRSYWASTKRKRTFNNLEQRWSNCLFQRAERERGALENEVQARANIKCFGFRSGVSRNHGGQDFTHHIVSVDIVEHPSFCSLLTRGVFYIV